MAFSRVQGTTLDVTSSAGTLSLTPTAGNLMTVGQKTDNVHTMNVPTDGQANSWQTIKNPQSGAGGNEIAAFYEANVNGAATVVTVSQNTSVVMRAVLEEFSGASTTAPLRDFGGSTGNSSNPSIATAGTASLATDGIVSWIESNVTYSSGSGFTLGSVAGTTRLAAEWGTAGSSGTQTATWSFSAVNTWNGIVATFVVGAGGGGTAVPTPQRGLTGVGR